MPKYHSRSDAVTIAYFLHGPTPQQYKKKLTALRGKPVTDRLPTRDHSTRMFAFSPLEWVALVLLSLIGLKFAWNVSNFLFTTFVGSWLGLNIDLRQYGPWAGENVHSFISTPEIQKHVNSKLMYRFNSGDWSYIRHRKSVLSQGLLKKMSSSLIFKSIFNLMLLLFSAGLVGNQRCSYKSVTV